MNVLIDDIRDIPNAHLVFRSGEAALDYFGSEFKACDEIDTLYMDHDLGSGMSGYITLNTIIETYGLCPYEVVMVTSNPVGRDRMGQILVANGYKKKTPTLYRRR